MKTMKPYVERIAVMPECFLCGRKGGDLKPIKGPTGILVWYECRGKCQQELPKKKRWSRDPDDSFDSVRGNRRQPREAKV